MGMTSLAYYLHEAGIVVEAFDDHFTEPCRTRMGEMGILIHSDSTTNANPDYVVRSSAVPESSDEVRSWVNKGIPVYRRGDFLSRLLSEKKVLAVVGSHGKTSTTGMLAWAFKQVGFPCSHLIGGRFFQDQFNPGQYVRSPWVLIEVDESDGSIDGFSPEITLALNCDWDHVDQYQETESFLNTLSGLFLRTKSHFICPQGSNIAGALTKLHHSIETSHFQAPEEPSLFEDSNRMAVKALGNALGLVFDGLDFSTFPGMDRRQSLLFESEDRAIIEDYAHHPSEIRAFLGKSRLIREDHFMRVVFQPHRFTRTKAMVENFAEELSAADELHLLPTYGAFEKFDPAGSTEVLLGHLPPRLRNHAKVLESIDQLSRLVGVEKLDEGQPDQILFVGAGNIDRWAHSFACLVKAEGNRNRAFSGYLESRLSPDCILRSNEAMAPKTTMGVGGRARWYAEPSHVEDLRAIVEACLLFGLPRTMIGRGSNLIIPDDGYEGLVLRLKGSYWGEVTVLSDQALIVGAGARLKEICRIASFNGLMGFEFFEGIPGSLGGALRMNAGAMGWETYDLVEWVTFLMPDGTIRKIERSSLNTGYRYCKEAFEGVALRAKLKAEGRSDHRVIRKMIEKLAKRRRDSQPREASSGCIFKNPENESAGRLIDQLGLKGERVGGAMVSEIHANFIVNQENASAEEVISLIRAVRDRVRDSNGTLLEPEIGVLGKEWRDYLS